MHPNLLLYFDVFLADHTALNMIDYWCHNVCLSVVSACDAVHCG